MCTLPPGGSSPARDSMSFDHGEPRRLRRVVAPSASSSGYPARGGHSTHEWPHTSHPLATTAPQRAHATAAHRAATPDGSPALIVRRRRTSAKWRRLGWRTWAAPAVAGGAARETLSSRPLPRRAPAGRRWRPPRAGQAFAAEHHSSSNHFGENATKKGPSRAPWNRGRLLASDGSACGVAQNGNRDLDSDVGVQRDRQREFAHVL